MATKGETNDIYCDLCQGRHITKQAVEYCPRCEEALCADCIDHNKYLKQQKLTKRYQSTSKKMYPSLFGKLNSTVMIMVIFLSSIVRHMTLFVVKDVLPPVIENVKTLLLLRIYLKPPYCQRH